MKINVQTVYSLITGILFILGSSQLHASPGNPIALLETIVSQTTTALQEKRAIIDDNPHEVYDIVNEMIVPHVDFVEMATWVSGRKAWRQASSEAQDNFIKEFKTLVIRTYGTALKEYTTEKFDFQPIKSTQSAKRIQVISKVTRVGKENIRVVFRLVNHNDTWKVYDMVIEGVSILQGFQAQFSNAIRLHGLAAVTQNISKHNTQSSKTIKHP